MIALNISQKQISEFIINRISVRKYTDVTISNQTLGKINTILSENNIGPFENESKFWLIHRNAFDDKPVQLGTYGFIRGANYFMVGAMQKNIAMNFEDYGYCKERKILELTALGLGTCWIGGTFRRNEYAKTVTLGTDETLPTISPVGYQATHVSPIDRLIKAVAASKKRKPFEELFFQSSFDKPLSRANANSFEQALEMLRLAPSANNAQPWRIVVDGNRFHFYLFRNKAISALKTIDLQRIDMGIAMCHFELALNEQEIYGKWEVLPQGHLTSKHPHYICSYQLLNE